MRAVWLCLSVSGSPGPAPEGIRTRLHLISSHGDEDCNRQHCRNGPTESSTAHPMAPCHSFIIHLKKNVWKPLAKAVATNSRQTEMETEELSQPGPPSPFNPACTKQNKPPQSLLNSLKETSVSEQKPHGRAHCGRKPGDHG